MSGRLVKALFLCLSTFLMSNSVLAQVADSSERIDHRNKSHNMETNSTKQALVIVDIQNDYFEGGKYPLYKPQEAAQNASEVLAQCRAKGIPVIHVQHINSKGAVFFEENTEGVEIHSSVKPIENEVVVTKHYPNSFRETSLKAELDKMGIEKLIIVGMMTHMCIDTTTRAAKDLGYECVVVANCCATRNLEYGGESVHAQAVQIAYLGALNGMFAKVVNSADLEL